MLVTSSGSAFFKMRDHLFGMVITKKIAQLVHKWAVANKQIGATMGLIPASRSSLKLAILDCEKWILTYCSNYTINSHLDYNYLELSHIYFLFGKLMLTGGY